jgi:uncharacterized protein (DUF2267 family)
LTGIRAVAREDAARAVFQVLKHHVDPNQLAHVREALPEHIRAF